MLEAIRTQFYHDIIDELKGTLEQIPRDKCDLSSIDHKSIGDKVFNVCHKVSGTAPMLGFSKPSELSSVIEKEFYQVRSGDKILTSSMLGDVCRGIEEIILALETEYQSQLEESSC